MKYSTFYNDNNNISSYRITIGTKSSQVSISQYMNFGRGGLTFKTNNYSARINNKGQSLGSSFKNNQKSYYYNKVGTQVSRMSSF